MYIPHHRPRRIKYYNNCLIHNVQRSFILQTGDPTGTGTGGNSIYGCVGNTAQRGLWNSLLSRVLYGDQARFFEHEIKPHLRHKKKGMVGMVGMCADAT